MHIFSNGPNKDFVLNPMRKLAYASHNLFIAAPYVTMVDDLAEAAKAGKSVRLLVGLNSVTSPKALAVIFGKPNVSIRYFTHRFHAKIYLFDDAALLGSSNLTSGGMQINREATIQISESDDLNELRALFQELWESAAVLTTEKLRVFTDAVAKMGKPFDPDIGIEKAVGRSEPANISVGSEKKSSEFLFLEGLRRRVHEQFGPAFNEVTDTLQTSGCTRSEWSADDRGSETNRFLNWVRLEHAPGDDWSLVSTKSIKDRTDRIIGLGKEWKQTDKPRIAEGYFDALHHARNIFGSPEHLESASKTDLSTALMAIHAFYEQVRFVKGGTPALAPFFWSANDEDVVKVKKTLRHLLFAEGDFILRLYQVLNDSKFKLRYFGESCALEFCGTVDPHKCPPMNGRSAKALRYLGFDVPAM